MSALLQALDRAADVARGVSSDERASPFFGPRIAREIIEPALRSLKHIEEMEGKYTVVAARSAPAFNATWLAQRFAERLLFGFSPTEIANDFAVRFESNTAEAIDVFLVYGPSIDNTIYISDDLWICNTDALNDLPGLENFLTRPSYAPEPSDTWTGSRIAICVKYAETNVLRQIPAEGPWRSSDDERKEKEHDEIAEKLIDIMTLIVSVPLLLLRRTSICPQPGSIGMAGLFIRGTGYQTIIPHAEPECICGPELKDWFDNYHGSRMWKDLNVSISRLRSSRLHFDKVNRAIDLGISLESALMRSEKSNAEITNKISTRYAWLVGTSPEDRRTAAKQVRNLYGSRSSAVHSGVVKENFNAAEAHAVCQSTLRALIKLGHNPDWDDIVFGA